MSNRLTYGFTQTFQGSPEDIEARVRVALQAEGFGVLTEIDVAATLKKKLDVDFRPYRILGACNPQLAHQALTEEHDIGLLLPCNVVVYAGDAPGTTVVSILDPAQQLAVSGRADLNGLANEVRARMERVLAAV
ncbi:MAG: DUF302 domain-containing protein [Gemmatimonadetes bacterium]|jgi:uncharacterized protein (DUF302 family)|nr:DUF302 domain-containing protein [Gemmatimonadota bacterium]